MNGLAFLPLGLTLMDLAGAALKSVIVMGVVLNVVPGLIYLERKISAYIQGRIGPNRVGPFGFLQPVADAIKLIFKEEIVPKGADRILYFLGPFLAFLPPALALAFVPFGPIVSTADGPIDLRIAPGSLLALFAVSSLGVYGIAMGGWASNSKYPLMGSLRASAQMISYEIAMGTAIIAIVAQVGSLDLQMFVTDQARDLEIFGFTLPFLPNWHIFHQPVAFLLFLIAMFAENNRLPFDLSEAEPELGAGYHTEYTGLKFALFFLGEYVAMITMSSVCVTLFFGGWHGPGVQTVNALATGWIPGLIGVFWFLTKVMLMLSFYIWVRWSLPRFRYDQLMRLGWKVLIPVGLANLFLTGVAVSL